MFYIRTDAGRASDTIARIASQLPIGMSMGVILCASPDGIMTANGDGAVWGVSDLTGMVWRMLPIGDVYELTRWSYGQEVGERRIIREPADGL